MFQHKYASLGEYFKDIARHAIDECILCGECVRHCLVFPLTPIKDNPPEKIMQKMIDFLKDGIFSEEVYLKAFSCAGCGYCADSCPQSIDPMLTHEAAKIELVEQGKKSPGAAYSVFSKKGLKPFDVLSALQTKPAEVRWLKSVPPRPERTENVVFLGCVPPAELPDKVFAFLDILNSMGIRYVALAGGELCCGASLCPGDGRVKDSEDNARKLVADLKSFSPERVILICPGCYRQFAEFISRFLDIDFRVQFFTQFLCENLDKLNFVKSLGETITLHDSCVLVRRLNDAVSPRRLLKAVPGLKLIEMKHTKEQTLCCGGLATHSYPQIGQRLAQSLLAEAEKTGTDYLVNDCPGCHSNLSPLIRGASFGLKHIATLVNESTGGREYKDKLDKFRQSSCVDEIIEQSRETFQENGFTEEEMREILPLIFPFLDE